jgi:hypothetical protein
MPVTIVRHGRIAQLLIGEMFTGFTLPDSEELTDAEIAEVWMAQDIILQDRISYGGNYTFSDITDLENLLALGAVRIVCESSLDEGDDDDSDMYFAQEIESRLRVVKAGYNPERKYSGFDLP